MKTFKIKNIFLIILTNYISLSYSQEPLESNRHYSFSVVLDMNHLSRNNEYNYKFLINKGWDYDENGALKYLLEKNLYFITFEYKKAFEKGFDHYDRIPKDTLKIELKDYQLDTIFRLTTVLMTFDKNINVTDKISTRQDYDGAYATVNLELDEYSTRNEINLSFENEDIFQNRFNKLLKFLNNIKDN